jgi:hypothetical protein
MKIKQFLLCFGFFAFLFSSCNLLIDLGVNGGDSTSPTTPPTNVPPRKFWAQNAETNSFYQLDADLLTESKNCRVWAEKGAGVTTATANSVAKAYEEKIMPKMMDTFAYNGPISDSTTIIANNTLELAGWMTKDDGKLTILLLDIKDGYKKGVNDGYVAGYFWAGNFYENNPLNQYTKYSNYCSMIYVDINPAVPGSEESNSTIAHELQHLMSFVHSNITERRNLLDTWVDEGLSAAAEWLYFGKQVDSRINWYNNDRSTLIQKGNNFFVWDNRENENQYANLDDYATVYLFFQWLRLQSGSTDIYKEITLSDYYDHRAVTNAANEAMKGNGYDDWGTLLKTWLAANYINAPSGPYGYQNDSILKNIKAKTAPNGVTNISLSPGEGVYSLTNNYNLPGNKQNVRYAGLDKSGKAISDTETFSGGALLTYNVNTNTKGRTESGTTTGVAASYADADNNALDRSVMGASFSGPYVIGFGDVLRRNGFKGMPAFDLTKPIKGITIRE